MHKSLATLALGGLTLMAASSAAVAEEPAAARDYLGVSAGIANLIGGKGSLMGGVQYVGKPLIWTFHPHAGGFVTHRGAVYGYAGFGVDVPLTDWMMVRGNTAVGAYGQGDDRDLGHVVEFRSGLELVFTLPNAARVGMSFHHISNAGLDTNNPGSEVLAVSYSVPLDRLF